MEVKIFRPISGSDATDVFEFERQVSRQMAFFVYVPTGFSGMFGNDTAGPHLLHHM